MWRLRRSSMGGEGEDKKSEVLSDRSFNAMLFHYNRLSCANHR